LSVSGFLVHMASFNWIGNEKSDSRKLSVPPVTPPVLRIPVLPAKNPHSTQNTLRRITCLYAILLLKSKRPGPQGSGLCIFRSRIAAEAQRGRTKLAPSNITKWCNKCAYSPHFGRIFAPFFEQGIGVNHMQISILFRKKTGKRKIFSRYRFCISVNL
jgi:hypothetical protein